ncbi:MFS transporter [Gordonia sp. VNQ95]|uniref:MFS transporter n=1 Tax=Gordonia sp. VNQ95 TaxID=3156619 RepID=UPI0032B5C4F0
MTAPTMTHTEPTHGVRAAMPGLLALAIASFLAVTTEMLPVGLLPTIGDAFGLPESTTGLLVTVYAAMVATLSVPLTIATRRFPRRALLSATVVGYLLSNIIIACAPGFAVIAAGRVVGGIAHALFFSVCIGYVPRIVEKDQVGRALAVVSGGSTAGFVLGVPISTTLGSLVGWRAAFAVLAGLAALTLALLRVKLPAVPGITSRPPARSRRERRDLRAVVTSNMATFIGQYTVYSYIAVILLTGGAHKSWIGPLLLVCGLCGLVGLACVGRTIDRRQRTTILAVLGLLTAAILFVGVAHAWLPALIVAVALWSGAFGGVPSMYQAAAVNAAPRSPELAGAWINSTANIGIALGALIGGRLIDGPLMTLAVTGAVFIVVGAAVIYRTRSAPAS